MATAVATEFGGLVGKTVESVRPLYDSELGDLYWENSGTVGFVVFFTDGSYFIPSCDAEGNGAGTLIFENKGK